MRGSVITLAVLLVSAPVVAVEWDPSGLQGVPVTQLEEDHVGRTGIYASTLGSGVQISTDGGHTWAPWNEGLGSDSVRAIDSVAPFGAGKCPYSLFYAATPTGVWCRWTEDASVADSVWHPANEGLSELDITAVATDGLWEAVCGTRGGALFRRSFGDTCWQDISSALFGSGPIVSVAVEAGPARTGDLIWVVSEGALGDGLCRSTDGGGSWELVTPGQPVRVVVPVSGNEWVMVGCSGGALGRSTDNGESWELCRPFPDSCTCTCYYWDRAAGTQQWAGSDSGGVMVAPLAIDWTIWFPVGIDGPLGVNSLATRDGAVLAATMNGVQRYEGASGQDPPLSRQPHLKLWPNPSSKGPALDLYPACTGPVRVALYDLLGRRLLAPDSVDPLAGAYSLALDSGQALSPGSYVCTVEAAGHTVSQRFVVTGP